MDNQSLQATARLSGYVTLIGSLCMLCGALLWGLSGADIDAFLYDNDLAGYLRQALDRQEMLIANLSLWILGVILIGAGTTLMTQLGDRASRWAVLVRYNYGVGIPLVVVSYMAWLAVVVRLAPLGTPEAPAIAEAMGWFGVRADWVATVLVLGTGPVLIARAGRDNWVPNWLRIGSYVALVTGVLNVIAQYTGGLTTYGFIIIPVGMLWMIAAAVTLLRLRFPAPSG